MPLYESYDGPQLNLKASVVYSSSVSIKVDSVSRAATHILLYRKKLGTPEGVMGLPEISSESESFDQSDLRMRGCVIGISGPMAVYFLAPAIYDKDAGVFKVDARSFNRLEAGEKKRIVCSVKEELIKQKRDAACKKASVFMHADGSIPFESLYYTVSHSDAKYPLPSEAAESERFSVFLPLSSVLRVHSLNSAFEAVNSN
ncbi:MAG: hypothetical protein LBU32_08550 [Clostridiales bacterium]|nr:hypothetical protein [Clostridiales bacterium]